jgi:8-amino-7-oxononanoate synthase
MAHAHREAKRCGILGELHSQIIPVLLGAEERTMEVAAALQARGFDIRGIRPPTVRPGTSRLRVSITGNVTAAEITALFEAIRSEVGTPAKIAEGA